MNKAFARKAKKRQQQAVSSDKTIHNKCTLEAVKDVNEIKRMVNNLSARM